jgi:signal transduction histidine kinase
LRHPVHVLRGNLRGIIDGVFPLHMEEIIFLEEETRHLSQLVNDLHELALAEAQELPLQKQDVDLGSLVQDAADAVHPLALDKNIDLQATVPSSPIRATVDPARLRQVIHNLLSNAIHYSPEGGRVTVSLAERDDGVRLEVIDDGVGLTAEELPHVFDRFYQADSSRDRALGGAGLGLAISKAIVEAHHGRITASSPGRDQGSTFAVHLPGSGPGEAP